MITSLRLQNFRCFSDVEFLFDHPFVLIEGRNGAGKSSIIEALHYACYLRSFRTHRPSDLVAFGQKESFVQLSFHDEEGDHLLKVGTEAQKKMVSLDGVRVSSYKEIMDRYRVITLSEDDMDLIQAGPEERRSFLNQYGIIRNPDTITLLRTYKQVLQQRNALFINEIRDISLLKTWTQQLWELTEEIRALRIAALDELNERLAVLLITKLQRNDTIVCEYSARMSKHDSFEDFWQDYSSKTQSEYKNKRSLFGAHLDDFSVIFNGKDARSFASRGQQKLLVVLLKLAQVALLQEVTTQGNTILLLDDFVTDFDAVVTKQLLGLVETLPSQVFITCPLDGQIMLSSRGDELQKITL